MARKRTLISWSSGKDSSWMLHQLQSDDEVEIVGLVTSFNEQADRVAMHAVRRELVEAQAKAIGLPLFPILLPWPCSNEEYESRMRAFIDTAKSIGVVQMAFGDLYLEDIRDYRIRQLEGTGIEPMFPIWCGRHRTSALAQEMVDAGVRAVVTCVDPKQIPRSFLGRTFDQDLIDDLPPSVDRCAENGEFHTFCYEGPHMASPLSVDVGEVVERNGFVYADVRAKEM